ncbi:helix-hairpin-helix domain-containing protein [Lacibacter sp. MH-610]|uniref:helix-hairpin-helix domain-containing protein n=1 Tax=Lacibacter sp. MH-610 TaxID=3020883 RepID=UPI0038923817
MPTNYEIADQFSLLSKLMDIHGENSFKAKSYAAAAFQIEKLPVQLADVEPSKIASYKGVGESTAKKVIEILQTGTLKALQDLIANTPPGVIEMLNIKGIGPKKIATIWHEMEIETVGELYYACQENRLLRYKGFGEKTQQTVMESIEFIEQHKGVHLYADVEAYVQAIDKNLKDHFPGERFALTGEFVRQMEVIHLVEWVTTAGTTSLKQLFETTRFTTEEEQDHTIAFKGPENVVLKFHTATHSNFGTVLFQTSASEGFLEAWGTVTNVPDEAQLFAEKNIAFIPHALREVYTESPVTDLIDVSSIKGIIHSHSKWSDGSNSIEEMARYAQSIGMEYLVISDHSKSAGYANGLSAERILEQHREIDTLNQKLNGFRIFKSIEADILGDGSLDYDEDVLSSFDLVIASVHSNLKMTEEKAMMRLMNAIENPYTTILGHMTGRLLLSRNGYPVNHEKIIDACVANQVVIELNAHPRRLDIDWRWIEKAINKGALISINPDAHELSGFHDIRFGVLAAQKGKLTNSNNLSSYSLQTFENYISELRRDKGI